MRGNQCDANTCKVLKRHNCDRGNDKLQKVEFGMDDIIKSKNEDIIEILLYL